MRFRARLAMTVILECDVKAQDGTRAYQAMKEYEALIHSKEWLHREAPRQIERVAMTFDMSKVELRSQDIDEDSKNHLKLG